MKTLNLIKRRMQRIPWYAWPVIIFAPGGLVLALYYIVEGDK